MEGELKELAKSTAEATGWQETAGVDEAAAETLTEKSVAEQADGVVLEEEGESLIAEGTVNQAEAATTEEEAGGLFVKATEGEGQSTLLLTEAAGQEVIVEEDAAHATVDAARAADDTAGAEADEAGTALCQFIPFVDVVCDVVGSIAAIGLETEAVRLAAMAAEEYANAAALQLRVESVTAEAAELQAGATELDEEAGALQSKAVSLATKAEEELAGGETDEAAAEEQFQESVIDKEAAVEEEAKAMTEEDESANAWIRSMQHGANACGMAFMTSLVSLVALFFWTIRIAGSLVVPVIKTGVKALWMVTTRAFGKVANGITTPSNILRPAALELLHTTSHVFHHGLFFVLFFGFWGGALLQLRNMSSMTAMGGILLGFTASLAVTQSFILHAVPRACQPGVSLEACAQVGFRELARWMLVLYPLVAMEILLVWVNAGSWAFVPSVVEGAQHWWLRGLLAVGIAVHYWNFSESSRSDCSTGQTNYQDSAKNCDSNIHHDLNPAERSLLILTGTGEEDDGCMDYGAREDEDEWESIEEALVETDQERLQHFIVAPVVRGRNTEIVPEREEWFFTLVKEDATRIRLVLVFEVLMASIMLALLRQSTPALQELWPASKAILLAAYPQWHIIAALGAVLVIVIMICACLY